MHPNSFSRVLVWWLIHLDFPSLKKVTLHDSNFYPVTIAQFESTFILMYWADLPSFETLEIGYGCLWGGDIFGEDKQSPQLIMKSVDLIQQWIIDLPNFTLLEGLADFGFNYMETCELESRIVIFCSFDVPLLEEIHLYGAFKYTKHVHAISKLMLPLWSTDADTLKEYIESHRQ